MDFFLSIAYFFTFIYGSLFFVLTYSFLTTSYFKSSSHFANFKKVSVVIAARNESENILNLLNDLASQNYPLDLIEVIVIDDYSIDNTFEKATSFKANFNLHIIKNLNRQGKKSALTLGVEHSTANLIFTTDADCSLPQNWLKTLVEFYVKYTPKMIIGPVQYIERSVFDKILNFELMGLVGIAASTLKLKNPTLSNGANLCFEKEVFLEVNGYEGNISIPSGDDQFLLKKVFEKYPMKIKFIKSREAIVQTKGPCSIKEFLNQRVRWASKWKLKGQSRSQIVAPTFIFIYSFICILIIFYPLFSAEYIYKTTIFFIIKIVIDCIFMLPVLIFFNRKNLIIISLPIQAIYFFYVTLVGILTLGYHYTWKGTKYH